MSLSFSYSQSSECFQRQRFRTHSHNCTYFVIVCLLIKTNVLKWQIFNVNKCLLTQLQYPHTMKVIMMNEEKKELLCESESVREQQRVQNKMNVYYVTTKVFNFRPFTHNFPPFYYYVCIYTYNTKTFPTFSLSTLFHSIKQRLFASFTETSFILNNFTRIEQRG